MFGAALYAVAIVVEAVRSHAWFAAALFVFIAFVALWVAGGRVRYRLGPRELEVATQFPTSGRAVRVPTLDVVDFVASAGAVIVRLRGGGSLELPRGTMRSDDEARALAEFLRVGARPHARTRSGLSYVLTMPIVWNEKARAELPPRTREAVPAFKHGKRDTIWATMKKSFALRGKYDPIDGTFVKGRALVTPELAKLMEECEKIARAEEPPALDDDVHVAAAFYALLSKIATGHPTRARSSRRSPSPVHSRSTCARRASASRRTT